MTIFLLALLAASLPGSTQETHHVRFHSTGNPAEDSRPNSDKVPDAIAIHAQLQRVVVLRFKFGADLLAVLNRMVAQEKIKNAVILSGVGSVRNYHVHQVGNRDMPPCDEFVKDPTGYADITGMSGIVASGRVHAHITLANPRGAFGGHLEPDTTVFTFAIVTLGILDDDVDMSRFDDWTYR